LTPQEVAKSVKIRIEAYPENYDQKSWFSDKEDDRHTGTMEEVLDLDIENLDALLDCGATACVAGHAILVGLESGLLDSPFMCNGAIIEDSAKEVLGLNFNESRWLFNPFRTREEVLGALAILAFR